MLKELVIKNRSYRGFDHSVKITKEELIELVDLARYTPATANIQPLKYLIVNSEEDNKKLLASLKFAGRLPQLHLPYEGSEPVAYIVICIDKTLAKPEAVMRDVGIVGQTILLGATEKGYGGCMVGSVNEAKVKSDFQLSEDLTIGLVIALGKPNEKIELVECNDGNIAYYRKDGIHYVPKRKLEDILL